MYYVPMGFIMGFCARCQAPYTVLDSGGRDGVQTCSKTCKRARKRNRPRPCPTPTKRVYMDQQAAVQAAVAISKLHNRPMYPYPCNDGCKLWHLTKERHPRLEALLPAWLQGPLTFTIADVLCGHDETSHNPDSHQHDVADEPVRSDTRPGTILTRRGPEHQGPQLPQGLVPDIHCSCGSGP